MQHDFPFSDDRRPMGRLGRLPLTVTNLVLLLNGALLLGTLLYSTWTSQDLEQLAGLMQLQPRAVVDHYEWFRMLSYPFAESVWSMFCTAIALVVFYFAGNEVEQFMGRRSYAWLLVALWLAPACFIVGLYPFEPGAVFSGTTAFYLGVVFTLTVLFPNAEVFMRVEARWAGLAIVTAALLLALANRQWTMLLVLAVTFLTCVVVLRRLGLMDFHTHFSQVAGPGRFLNEGYHNSTAPEFLREHERMRKMEALESRAFEGVGTRSKTQRAVAQEQLVEEEPEDVYEVIDPLLEKIAQGGMESLTLTERETLESARLRLLQGEKR